MDGINLSSYHLSRNSAIEKLLDLLRDQIFVVVNATAASGKTPLLQLVASRVHSIGLNCLGTSMSGFDLLKAEGLDLVKKQSKFNDL